MVREDFVLADKIKKDFLKRYNRDPSDWSIIQGIDEKKFINTFILNPEESWFIKEFPVNPYKTLGLGTPIDIKKDIIRRFSKPGFGFRSLPEDIVDRISKNSNLEIKKIILDALMQPPKPLKDLEDKIVLGGPLFVSEKNVSDIGLISEEQRKLDRKLAIELEKLVRRKYPQIFSQYI